MGFNSGFKGLIDGYDYYRQYIFNIGYYRHVKNLGRAACEHYGCPQYDGNVVRAGILCLTLFPGKH